jgi:hypothetical protein
MKRHVGENGWGSNEPNCEEGLLGRLAASTTSEEIIRDEACPDLSGDGSTYYRVKERVIDWCMARPDTIPFEPDGIYKR